MMSSGGITDWFHWGLEPMRMSIFRWRKEAMARGDRRTDEYAHNADVKVSKRCSSLLGRCLTSLVISNKSFYPDLILGKSGFSSDEHSA